MGRAPSSTVAAAAAPGAAWSRLSGRPAERSHEGPSSPRRNPHQPRSVFPTRTAPLQKPKEALQPQG